MQIQENETQIPRFSEENGMQIPRLRLERRYESADSAPVRLAPGLACKQNHGPSLKATAILTLTHQLLAKTDKRRFSQFVAARCEAAAIQPGKQVVSKLADEVLIIIGYRLKQIG